MGATGLLLTTLSGAFAALNLNSSKSNLNSVPGAGLVSATARLSGPAQTQEIYITPPTNDFILTQLCASPGSGGMLLAATTFGLIVHVRDGSCQAFPSGISIPRGTTLTCSTFAIAVPERSLAIVDEHLCTISGLLFTRGDRPPPPPQQ